MNELMLLTKENEETLIRASNMLSKSPVIPTNLKGNIPAIYSILLMGAELGLKPMQSINSIHVIQGRTALSAQLMLSIVKKRCPDFRISMKISGDKTSPVVIVRGVRHGGDEEFETKWDMSRAGALGLIGKDNWKKQPITMLQWRAVSEVCRFLAPEAVLGIYTDDEAEDIQAVSGLNDPELEAEKRLANPEWYVIGAGTYKIQNAKYRDAQLQDIDPEELADYLEKIEKRAESKKLKSWEQEVMQSIRIYLKALDGVSSDDIEDVGFSEITTDDIPFD